jgi:hypothetical protein
MWYYINERRGKGKRARDGHCSEVLGVNGHLHSLVGKTSPRRRFPADSAVLK